MKPADLLWRLRRRWYLVIPGLLLAVAAVAGVWNAVGPEYERTGTQMLLPGPASLPEDATNPFLFLGGLSLPADVIVQSVSGENVLGDVLDQFPGAEVVVDRGVGSAPVIRITVAAKDDDSAEQLLAIMMDRTVATLEEIQTSESIAAGDRMSLITLAVDTESTLRQRTRTVAAVGAGVAVAIIALAVAALADGLATRRRRAAKVSDRGDHGPKRQQSPESDRPFVAEAGADTEPVAVTESEDRDHAPA